ncbi:hypothetical protein PF011_g12050 [Phytophthora fragariae]|uniref:BUD13 homolog n=1 Tax=Phytophthora fragariae TaxID=53985 RepID=A0A6A3KFR3_9STRA|nr:hypothetical protein PF011_g12050 [Phytophthora fragariae]
MTSKLEYLQRYMSGGGDAADGEKKKKKVKKTKKSKSSALGTRVVDADDAWEQSAPSRDDIEKKWELDAAEEEQPLVVAADGEEIVDPQDLPVYVDSDKYLDEFRGRKRPQKENEDGDLSPPRKKTGKGRRGGEDSEDDKSPPRRPKSDDASPPRRRSGGDKRASRRRREESDEDARDASPPRRGERRGRDADASPPRGREDDASPPRRRTMKSSARSRHGADDKKEEKKAGLFTAAEFEHQRKIAAKRKDVLRGVDASEMGANAETVYRDKRGRKLDMLNEMVRQQEVLEGKRKREEREEYEWGTGEVQKRERKSQQELLDEMKKTPFARHEDDKDLERKRRERVRAFDPINSKIFQEDPLAEGKSKNKKSKKDKKKASKLKPKYAGPPAPPNRFGITPGYRWDGVVRGTNWEEKIMMRQNANAAVSEEAYKYAVADM